MARRGLSGKNSGHFTTDVLPRTLGNSVGPTRHWDLGSLKKSSRLSFCRRRCLVGWPRCRRGLLLLSHLISCLLQLKTCSAAIGELEGFNNAVPALRRVRGSSSWTAMSLHMRALRASGAVAELIQIALIDP